jgi:hypothetical protein
VLDRNFLVLQVPEGIAEEPGYLPREIRGRLITDFIQAGDFPDHEHLAPVRLKR